jgi:hypothetical protein
MPVYIAPNRNLVPATPDFSGTYTKVEADARFVHNFGNEVVNGIKIFPNTPYFNSSIKIVNITPGKVLTTDVSGIVTSSLYSITDLTLQTTTDTISAAVNTEIDDRIAGDNYLQQQINQVAAAQYLIFSEQVTGNGITSQFQLNGTITNAQFVSGGWNVINVQNALPSDVTDINGKPIYDASLIYLFTRHRIGVNSITGNGYVNLDYIPQNNQIFKIWYWYSLTDFDRIDNYYRDDFVAKMEETAGELATATAVNTANFINILSSSDDTVQKALQTVDDKSILKTEVSTVSGYLFNKTNEVSQALSGYVPYSGAISDVNLGSHKITTDSIIFNNSAISSSPRQISWNDTENTFNMGLTNDVTLQVGQEELILVHNHTAINITNGQPICIIGYDADDHPSVTLAGATLSGNCSIIAGVATELISSGGSGFSTVRGKVRGLNTSGYTPGERIFLGETPGTFTSNISAFEFSSRLNQVGYVGIVDSISGSIYVSIINENAILSLSEQQSKILLGNSASTGLFEYSGMTISTSSTFTVPTVKGWIIKNTYENATFPQAIFVNFSGGTYSVTNLTTQNFTHILIDENNNIIQQYEYPTPQQRRENIYLGKIIHLEKTIINFINNFPDYEISPFSAVRDVFTPIALINEGITIYPDGSNLSFNKSAGNIYGFGINWINNQKSPNKLEFSANMPVSGFYYATQLARTFSPVSQIDPTNYDVGGTITPVPGPIKSATNQRVYQFSSGNVIIQYGQTVYDDLTTAVINVQTEPFVKFSGIYGSAILIGVISLRKDCTDLSNISSAIFTPVSMFGEPVGGFSGISTTSLQQAYDNSIQPEIVTNSTLDGVTFRRGSDNETDHVIQIQNGAGTNVVTFNGLGDITTSSLSGNANNFVSHDISGRLLDSGFNSVIANNMSANAYNQSIVYTNAASANLQQQILSISQTQGVTGNYVSLDKSESISGQKTFTAPITLTNGTTAQFYTSIITQTAPFNNIIVDEFNVGPFNGCNWDVVIKDNSNLRICNVMAGWMGSGQSTYTEANAPDIGDTSSVALSVSLISGGTVIALQSTAIGNSNWTVKSLRKCL